MADSIFQGNPRHFNLDTTVAASREQWWGTPRYRDRMAVGDRVWLPGRGPKTLASTTSRRSCRRRTSTRSAADPAHFRWRTDIRFDCRVRPPLLRSELLEDVRLGSFRPFRGFQGSTCPCRRNVAAALAARAAPRLEPLPPEGRVDRAPASSHFSMLPNVRGHSVEIELVALDVLHHEARLVVSSARSSRTRTAPSATSRAHSASSAATRSSPTSPVPTRTSRCSRFLTTLPSGTRWKNSRGPAPEGSMHANAWTLILRRQRAIEIVPGGEPLRWRRYDVPQHLAPETSDALRFCAVEGDLELLDRRHRSTIEAGLSSSPQARPGSSAPGARRCRRSRRRSPQNHHAARSLTTAYQRVPEDLPRGGVGSGQRRSW